MSLRNRIAAALNAFVDPTTLRAELSEPQRVDYIVNLRTGDAQRCDCARLKARCARLSTMLDVRTSELQTARARILELVLERTSA